MENETKKVSGAFLRKSIKKIRSIRRSDFSQSRYAKQQELEYKASLCLDDYVQDLLIIEPKNRGLFAEFIKEFTGPILKEILLDKLQKESDFDVRKYLERRPLSWWQRIFHKNDELTVKKMQKKIAKANSLIKKIKKKEFFDGLEYVEKLRALTDEAEKYIEAYNKGEFVPQDSKVFEAYVRTVGDYYIGCPAEQALKKLSESPVIKPQKKAKAKSGRKFSFVRSIKYAAVGIFAGIVSWFGFKSVSTQKDSVKHATEIKVTPVKHHRDSVAGLDVWQSFAQKHAAEVNSTDGQRKQNVSVANGADQSSKKQIDMGDFYADRLVRFTSKGSAQKRIADFLQKTDAGIVSLPKDISVNRFLYAEQIYRKYGFKDIANELNSAINASAKVEKQEQEKLFRYVRAAGDKGEGVQKMSQQPTLALSLMQSQDDGVNKGSTINGKQEMSDFYATRLAQFTSEKRAQKLITDFSQKVDAGIISLPEDISVNRFLYTQQIYKKYGFKSIANEFQSAIKSENKVSTQKQEKLFKYVREAGEKGVGVKKKVIRLNYKNLKELRDSRRR